MSGFHARCEESIERALGAAAYERALTSGGGDDSPGQALDLALGTGAEPVIPVPAPSLLTRRKQEPAAMVATGMSDRQIAAELVVSTRTVDFHVGNIRAKLGFGGRTQVAVWWATQEPHT